MFTCGFLQHCVPPTLQKQGLKTTRLVRYEKNKKEIDLNVLFFITTIKMPQYVYACTLQVNTLYGITPLMQT